MGEALEKVIDFGFNKMKLRTIEAFTHNENVPSIKLLVRNNFKLNNTQEMPNKKNRIMFSLTKEIK
jgi:ribosomal-protein-alanine N-acetyltransferase